MVDNAVSNIVWEAICSYEASRYGVFRSSTRFNAAGQINFNVYSCGYALVNLANRVIENHPEAKEALNHRVIDDIFSIENKDTKFDNFAYHLPRYCSSLELSEDNKLYLLQKANKAIVECMARNSDLDDNYYYKQLTQLMDDIEIKSREAFLNNIIAQQTNGKKLSNSLAYDKPFAGFLSNEFFQAVTRNSNQPVVMCDIAAGNVAGKLALVFSEKANDSDGDNSVVSRVMRRLMGEANNHKPNNTYVNYNGSTFSADGIRSAVEQVTQVKPLQNAYVQQFEAVLALKR